MPMRRRAPVLCVSILALLAVPACLHAQEAPPKTGLAAAISQIQARDFVNALVTLNEVVAQQAKRPEQATTLATAHAYRAAAFIGLEQPEWARGAALEALKADSRIIVTAAAFGPRVAALFEAARSPARDPEAVGQAAETAGRFQDAFLAYLSALQSLTEPPAAGDDQRLREKIIKMVAKLEPKPAVPEEARTRLAKADALLAAAPAGSSDSAVAQAAIDLRQAVRIAPWWPDAIVRLATTLQRSGRFDDALINLSLYQLADPEGYAATVGVVSPPRAEPERVTPAAREPTVVSPALIYVYFPHAARGLGVKSKVLCDGQKIADLAHEHYIVFRAASGFHNFEFKGQKAGGSFEGGKDHYFRVGIEGYPAHFVLRATSPQTAAAEIRDKKVLRNEPQNTFSAECTSVAAPRKSR